MKLERNIEAKRSPNYYRDGYPDMINGVTCVLVNEFDFNRLPTYDCSVPTGVCDGKIWKRSDRDGLWLGSYDEENGAIYQNFRPLKIMQ